MKWITDNIEMIRNMLGAMLVIPAPHDNFLSKLDKNKKYSIEIKELSKRRSNNANSYCWALCGKIALELSKNGYTSKEEVYRKAIRDCGIFIIGQFSTADKDEAIKGWSKNGIGWFADDMGESAYEKDIHILHMYKGSSIYNTKEMARLIDCLVDECHQLDIPLEPSEYIKSLIDGWGNEQSETRG